MASGDRAKRLKGKVQRLLKDQRGLGVGRYQDVYDALNDIQRRITEEAQCIEEDWQCDLDGSEYYILPDDLLSIRKITPSSGTTPVEEINLDEAEILKREADSNSQDNTPVYWYRWKSQIGFLNASGTAPASGSMKIQYWRSMAETGDDISDSSDPIVNVRWNSALVWGAVAEITGADAMEAKFTREFERVRDIEKGVSSEVFDIPPTEEYD